MTEIVRSIEIDAPVQRVWSYIHPDNWTTIFNFVREVNGYTNGEPGVGAQARIVAGTDITAIKYNVEVTEFVLNEKIAYRRYGGPLNGSGTIMLKSLNAGTLMRRKSLYEDALSEEIVKTLSVGMENDNMRIKKMVEADKAR